MLYMCDGVMIEKLTFERDHALIRSASGCFETLRIEHQKILQLDAHLDRALHTLQHFFSVHWEGDCTVADDMKRYCREVCACMKWHESPLRLRVSFWPKRATGTSFSDRISVLMVMEEERRQRPSTLSLGTVTGIEDPFASYKLLAKPSTAQILNQAQARGHFDLLRCDDFLYETAIANVFWLRDQRLITPELGKILPGTMRQQVLANAMAERRFAIEERPVLVSEMTQMDACFITNSLIGVWWVDCIETHTYKRARVDRQALTKRLLGNSY